VLLESVKEGSICSLQRLLVIIHEDYTPELVMDKTLRIHLGTKSYAAIPFVSIDCKILIEKIIQGAVDMIFTLKNDRDTFLNVEDDIIK
jgi:hypothetical protein